MWDDLTFGPARRRRQMMRRLRALDRLDARERRARGSRPVRARPYRKHDDALRRFLVGVTTIAVVLLMAVVVLDRQWGISIDTRGLHRRSPLGSPPTVATGTGAFRFMATQPFDRAQPVAYDPCRPVDVVVNEVQAPPGSAGIVEEAVAEVAHATGLRIGVVGTTDEPANPDRPARDRDRYGGDWSPVLVAWTDPAQVPALAGDVAGLGGSQSAPAMTTEPRHFVTGSVSLDAPQLARVLGRENGRAVLRAIVMHELGHVVGLRHVDSADELMYEDNVGLVDFGPGDREGLAALGRGRCF
jgi:hypothetical protein